MSTVAKKSIRFYYLSAFSRIGGIENFNRCLIKGMNELATEYSWDFKTAAAYDDHCDERYTPQKNYQGFAGKKVNALMFFIREGMKGEVIILGHINLAMAGIIIKMLNPRCKLVVIAHGAESWRKLRGMRMWCMQKADLVLAVSNYTKNQLILRNRIKGEKIRLFPNTLDPFFKLPQAFEKPAYLLGRYKLRAGQPVIFTLSRLRNTEQQKGYDRVIQALPDVLRLVPDCVYILAGELDSEERNRVVELIELMGLKDKVILPGFIKENEVPNHYQLADVFILPSKKEGFGIVFLEALACGTPIIGGNQDGTVDAFNNGSLGQLINPTRHSEIVSSVVNQLVNKPFSKGQELQKKVMALYQFSCFKNRLHSIYQDITKN